MFSKIAFSTYPVKCVSVLTVSANKQVGYSHPSDLGSGLTKSICKLVNGLVGLSSYHMVMLFLCVHGAGFVQ